ncbi:MAG: oxidoreductase [Bryobacterales bacterium]|nr:oxidoreductase [Bryobacterales bacterium]
MDSNANQSDLRLITVDPGHFHAALLQKQQLRGVASEAHVYAPLGPDLLAHLDRVSRFNARAEDPTQWKLRVYAGKDFLEKMLAEVPGNIAVFSGRNAKKLDLIEAAVNAGLHVLADKPLILERAQHVKLRDVLETARRRNLAVVDAMTQRFEVTCRLMRCLVNDPAIFGERVTGSLKDPAVRMESIHYLIKRVAGVPNLRPLWFFDSKEQGEGLTDVGTHLVDQVQWILMPDREIDIAADVSLLQATRWPTTLTLDQLRQVTGLPLDSPAQPPALDYFCNNTVRYALGGVHVSLDIRWDVEPPAGVPDTEYVLFRGSRARVEIRQEKEANWRPDVHVLPEIPADRAALREALENRIAALQSTFDGLAARECGEGFRLDIPDRHRIGHEAHFSKLANAFLEMARNPATVPAWEHSCLLAKYFVTTEGVALARREL